jgi:arginine/ornithine transport system substrate-binding protein
MRMTSVAFAIVTLLTFSIEAKEWTKIRFGVEGAYPPFSEVTADGQLKGFDIDVANALCKQMKAECILVQQEWEGIIPALLAGNYDAIIASMAITEERKKTVDFTNKYYNAPAQFVRRKGSAIQIAKQDMQGKRVGVQCSTTHENYLAENYGTTVQIVCYGTQNEANLDLIAGRVDMLLGNTTAMKLGLLDTERGKDFEFVGPALVDEKWFGVGSGIALRKENQDLKRQLNTAIDEIRKNGEWEKIARKYFGDLDVWGDATD